MGHWMRWSVAPTYLRYALRERQPLSARPGGRVRCPEHVLPKPDGCRELSREFITEALRGGVGCGVGVLCDQPTGRVVPAVRSQVAGAVQRVEACLDRFSRVSDVVQPCGGDDSLAIEINDCA